MLHTFHDGSHLCIIGARELIAIQTWKGNRVINHAHVADIKAAIHDIRSLDSGFKIVDIEEADAAGAIHIQSYIIDGQHRTEVLRTHFRDNLCEPDFPVVIQKKKVASEYEAIAYFNAINNTKPIHFSEPNIIANKYISLLEQTFNTPKLALIRHGNRHRPYLSVDKVREYLLKNELKESESDIKKFIDKVVAYNTQLLREVDLHIAYCKKSGDVNVLQRSSDLKFMLAFDPKLSWIRDLL